MNYAASAVCQQASNTLRGNVWVVQLLCEPKACMCRLLRFLPVSPAYIEKGRDE
jgi:hypothetical protein